MLQPGGPYMVVFDVGDTEPTPGAPPLPTKVTDPLAVESRLSDARLSGLWHRTVDNAARDGIRVSLVNQAAHHAGQTYWTRRVRSTVKRPGAKGGAPETFPLQREIEVNQNLAPAGRYATLVHELAHLYCGHIGTPDPKRWPDRRGGTSTRDELEAESVAYIVLSRLDDGVKMGDYLLNYIDSENEMPDGVELRLIIQVASTVLKMGESRLPRGAEQR